MAFLVKGAVVRNIPTMDAKNNPCLTSGIHRAHQLTVPDFPCLQEKCVIYDGCAAYRRQIGAVEALGHGGSDAVQLGQKAEVAPSGPQWHRLRPLGERNRTV